MRTADRKMFSFHGRSPVIGFTHLENRLKYRDLDVPRFWSASTSASLRPLIRLAFLVHADGRQKDVFLPWPVTGYRIHTSRKPTQIQGLRCPSVLERLYFSLSATVDKTRVFSTCGRPTERCFPSMAGHRLSDSHISKTDSNTGT